MGREQALASSGRPGARPVGVVSGCPGPLQQLSLRGDEAEPGPPAGGTPGTLRVSPAGGFRPPWPHLLGTFPSLPDGTPSPEQGGERRGAPGHPAMQATLEKPEFPRCTGPAFQGPGCRRSRP